MAGQLQLKGQACHLLSVRSRPHVALGNPSSAAAGLHRHRLSHHRPVSAAAGGWQTRRPRSLLRSSSRLAGKPLPPSRTLLGQRYVSVSSRRCGSRTIVAVALVGEQVSAPVEQLLDEELCQKPDLLVGRLANGLRYVIMPNKVPPERFEAHLEMHAGSVDELNNQRGMAHIVEHVTFLGSRKREALLGTGARSNAYTDFHHTVFHVHAPLTNQSTGQAMLPQVLDALTEIAFEAEFLDTRIEKERRAVLAEAQMMNTIEYRVDCQLLQYLHEENALGSRFPIGKTEQVNQWTREQMRSYWQQWYFPANATLYVVGELDRSVQETEQLIAQTFGRIPAAVHGNGNGTGTFLRQRHEIRPPVEHIFGCGPLPPAFSPAPVKVFRHRLLQHFMLSIFCKLPIRSMTRMRDLRHSFMARIVLSVLQFRVNARYVRADPPFISIEMDHSDSGREGCAVTTLTVTSEPRDWRGAVQVAVQEVRRLQRYGVSPTELERYKAAMLRDSALLAEQGDSTPSVDNLDFVMECMAIGATVMDTRESHHRLMALADTITAEEVNALAKSLLSCISHYGHEGQLDAESAALGSGEAGWAEPGATRSTSVVACIPAFTDASGQGTGDSMPLQRGASMTTSEHIDPAIAAARMAAMDDPDSADVPEGAVRFELEAAEIEAAIAEESLEVEAPAEIEVPETLIADDRLQELLQERQPRYVPLELPGGDEEANAQLQACASTPSADIGRLPVHEGILQRRLSNGIRINARRTDNEPSAGMLRLLAAGGRACESLEVGPTGFGSVAVGMRTLNEAGTVGHWHREQVELFCISKLINCMLDADEEWLVMDFHFAVGDGGLRSVLELLHLFIEAPVWETDAMERARQLYISNYRSLPKSLERATADRVSGAIMGSDRRFRDANPEEIEALTLAGMRQVVMSQLHAGNIEVNIVGDIDYAELDALALQYLGTIAPRMPPPQLFDQPVALQRPTSPVRIRWHLKDSDERACAYIAGRAPPRWGPFEPHPSLQRPPQDEGPHALQEVQQREQMLSQLARLPTIPPRPLRSAATSEQVAQLTAERHAHPVHALVTLTLLTEVINSRLFTTVRDALGLTYDVNFDMSLHDRLGAGLFVVIVTSTPAKIQEAMDASLRVLRTLYTQRITSRELQRAKRTVLTRHESDLKDNRYWLGLLSHLQSPHVPLKSVACLRDLEAMYQCAEEVDLYHALGSFNLNDESVFTCIGTSGREAPQLKPFEEQNAGNLLSMQNRQQPAWQPMQRGSNGSPNKQPGGGITLDPKASASVMMSALLRAAQNGQLSSADAQQLSKQDQQQQR